MQIVIVTGMSGAGKSRTMEALEDLGFYCIENIPPVMLSTFIDLCLNKSLEETRYAILVDARSAYMFGELSSELKALREKEYRYKLLFIDADEGVLIKRYKETRRKHPLVGEGTIEQAIVLERELMTPVREQSDYVIDTSHTSVIQLKERLAGMFFENRSEAIIVNILSFGFKYGLPAEADLVFDVRYLPNPFYIDTLRNLTGLDKEVSDYVMGFDNSREILKRLCELLDYLIPLYRDEEAKSQLVVAIGCTGGKHRSVTISMLISEYLRKRGFCAVTNHRDVHKI